MFLLPVGSEACQNPSVRLFREGDVEEFAGRILLLLDDSELMGKHQSHAEKHLRKVSPEAVAGAYEAHFAACNWGIGSQTSHLA